MPRIRSLKPEALQHRKIGRLSDRAFRLWIGMLTQADDEGRLVADTGQLRVLTFGYFQDVGENDVEIALKEVVDTGIVALYEAVGVRYAIFPSWHDHQLISHPSRSKLPGPPEVSGAHRNLPESSGIFRNVPQGSDLIGSDLIGSPMIIADARKSGLRGGWFGFETFWAAYPRRVNRDRAERAWGKLQPDGELQAVMLKAIEAQKLSEGWTKEGGQFIPHASTWLNGKRWTDDLMPIALKPKKDLYAGHPAIGGRLL